MPMQRDLYSPDWEEEAFSLKAAANWTCTACQRPCRLPNEDDEALIDRIINDHPHWSKDLYAELEDEEFGLHEAPTKLGRFTLTVAHLNHQPEDNRLENLKPLCTVCHCCMDIQPSALFIKRQLKREREGQLNLLSPTAPTAQPAPEPPSQLLLWYEAKAAFYLKLMRRFADSRRSPRAMRRHEITRLYQLRYNVLAQIKPHPNTNYGCRTENGPGILSPDCPLGSCHQPSPETVSSPHA